MTIQLPPLPEPIARLTTNRHGWPEATEYLLDAWREYEKLEGAGRVFTADQLRTAQREAALMALEEAEKACDCEFIEPSAKWAATRCANAIRALRTELENTK